jgi:hypothetical protein
VLLINWQYFFLFENQIRQLIEQFHLFHFFISGEEEQRLIVNFSVLPDKTVIVSDISDYTAAFLREFLGTEKVLYFPWYKVIGYGGGLRCRLNYIQIPQR